MSDFYDTEQSIAAQKNFDLDYLTWWRGRQTDLSRLAVNPHLEELDPEIVEDEKP